MAFNIPDGEMPKLERIATLTEKVFQEMLSELRSAKPAITLNKFARSLQKVKSNDARKVLSVIGSLYLFKDKGLTSEEVASGVAETAAEENPTRINARAAETLRTRIKALLDLDKSVGITSKANDVLTEHQRTFCEARVLSDVRPIFPADLKSPQGAVIVHTLKIEYHENGDHKEFYVALDTNDIEALKDVVLRAEEKSAVLEKFIQQSKIPYIKV